MGQQASTPSEETTMTTTVVNENGSVKVVEENIPELNLEDEIKPIPVPPPNPLKMKPVTKRVNIHVLIELMDNGSSEQTILNTLKNIMLEVSAGYQIDMDAIEMPALLLFSHAVASNMHSVVDWMMINNPLLKVSYDDNFMYHECLRNRNVVMAEKLTKHESFIPTNEILDDFIARNRMDLFAYCMNSPYLRNDMKTYQYTMMYYAQNGEVQRLCELFEKLKLRTKGQFVQITDKVYTNPRIKSFEEQDAVFMEASTMNLGAQLKKIKLEAEKEAMKAEEEAKKAEAEAEAEAMKAEMEVQAKIAKIKADAEAVRKAAMDKLAEAKAKISKAKETSEKLGLLKNMN
jgi:hypothetical protein